MVPAIIDLNFMTTKKILIDDNEASYRSSNPLSVAIGEMNQIMII